MNRAALTALYLDRIRQSGAGGDELAGDVAESDDVLLNAFYPGLQYLSRPVFVDAAERDQLYCGVETVRGLLVSLPDRLYAGDFAAFARDAGATDYQVAARSASRSDPVSPQARADLYEDASGFKLMEFNMGTALAGLEIADVCRVMLRHPLLAGFAAEHGLGYHDTQRDQVANMLTGTGFTADSGPVVAVADWPSSYHGRLGPYMHKLALRWREYGLDAHACHLGELKVSGGRVWLEGRRVDIVARMFLIEYLLEPGAPELMDPVLGAAARGEVAMFTPLDTELYGSKATVAMLSDERNRPLFSAAELASIDALVPWTRMVRPGPVTLEDGSRVDLFDYAVDQQDDLLLKPTLRFGGHEVLPGWQHGTGAELWRDRLAHAAGGPYVLQRRIRPVPDLFPGPPGEMESWIVAWGLYTGVRGFSGIWTRGATV
ncbi:MAG: hypothetical protein ACRDNF_13750, partial [Streptosporangiaceae bacterium]